VCTLGAFESPSCNPLTLCQLQSPVTTAQRLQFTLSRIACPPCQDTQAERLCARACLLLSNIHHHQFYCLSLRLRETYVSWEMNIDMKGLGTLHWSTGSTAPSDCRSRAPSRQWLSCTSKCCCRSCLASSSKSSPRCHWLKERSLYSLCCGAAAAQGPPPAAAATLRAAATAFIMQSDWLCMPASRC
jgi:hypothetical protein